MFGKLKKEGELKELEKDAQIMADFAKRQIASVKPKETELAAKEIEEFGADKALDWHSKRLDNFSKLQDIRARKHFAWLIFTLNSMWLTAVLVVVVLAGLKRMTLPENVVIALLGTTTANVIGLFAIVAKYLFRSRDADSAKPADPKS